MEPSDRLAYDAAGRLRSRDIGSGPDSMVYDPAGNMITARYRSGLWVTQSYDAVDRLLQRVVPERKYPSQRCIGYSAGPISGYPDNYCFMIFPYYPNAGDSLKIAADTSRFVYDSLGNMTGANNRYARVRRTYYSSGALKADTTAIGRISSPLTDSLTRGQQYVYDLSGKRTSMQWFLGTNGYSYNDFGALSAVTDPSSNQYGIKYTLAGQVDSLILGTGVTEDRDYDADGRLTYRDRVSSYGTLGTLGTDAFGYDRMNRVIHASEQNHAQLADETWISYDGLGAVLAKEQSNAYGSNVEEFRNDAVGNVLYRKTQRTAGTNDAPFTFQYSPRGELMTSFSHLSSPSGQNELADTLEQDFLGQQLSKEDRQERDPDDGSVSLELATRHYYGAADKLMAVQRYSWRDSTLSDGTWEEYWYDALGRRVLTRARRDPISIYDAMISGPLCKKQNQNSDPKLRDFSTHARPGRNEYDLCVGQEYVAMGVGFWDERAWVEIATEGGFILSVPLTEFEIVNGIPSTFWVTRMDADGSVRLWPPSFYQDSYHSDLADRKPSVVADFERVRESLEAEDRRQLIRLGS